MARLSRFESWVMTLVTVTRVTGYNSSHWNDSSSYRLNSKSVQGIYYRDSCQVKFLRISTRVRAQKMRLESTRVRVTDLTKLGVSAHIYATVMSAEREAKTCVRAL